MSGIATHNGTYENGNNFNVGLGNLATDKLTIIISGNADVFVTNAPNPDDNSIWSQCTLTNNGCAVSGPVTGVRFEATGSGSYQIAALTE